MTAARGSDERNVIPRWRSVGNSVATGELTPVRPAAALTDADRTELENRRIDWEAAERSETYAAEFLSTAVVLGVPNEARDAAEFLAADATKHGLREFGRAAATAAVGGAPLYLPPSADTFSEGEVRRNIAALRRSITRDPRNAISWMELGRFYTAFGPTDKARRSVQAALYLAPGNRYVLRSAACYHVMMGSPDTAHDLLRRSDATPYDPWLIAAELATAGAAGRPPRHAKLARRLSDDHDLSPLHISELTSELATLELRAGADKRARSLFRQSLVQPTENSVAQAEWASHRASGLLVTPSELGVHNANEARFLHAEEKGEWSEAVDNAVRWLEDQPFDPDAAAHASYTAAVGLEQWADAAGYADIGLRSHPTQPTLLNNAAYARIEAGDLEGGARQLRRIRVADTPSDERVAVLATLGLFAFRSGDLDRGRGLYRKAAALAHQHRASDVEAMAWVMLAREEMRCRSDNWAETLAQAENAGRRTQSAAVRRWLERLTGSRHGSISANATS